MAPAICAREMQVSFWDHNIQRWRDSRSNEVTMVVMTKPSYCKIKSSFHSSLLAELQIKESPYAASHLLNSYYHNMKDPNSKVSYVCVFLYPLIKKSNNSIRKSFFSSLLGPNKARYLLLVLAIYTGLNVFLLGFDSPFISCISDHGHRRRLNTDNDSEFIESNMGVVHNEEFWKQPDGLGYHPCLNFSHGYQKTAISRKRVTRFLTVVVSGGLNQQKTQIVDAVVIARILEATLIIPILKVNPVWGDESEFSDIFDELHFKETLRNDVNVVSSLPSSYLRKRPLPATLGPSHIDEGWIRAHITPSFHKNAVILLRGFDSRLSKNLTPDLQKLRCKVAFHALKFKPWIEKLGEKMAERMTKERGPFMALHLRLEKDVWVRTGCNPGLDEKSDRVIELERASHPELLTSRSNVMARDRYIAGLCPLNAIEISRLLKGLGASNSTRIYWAGGLPLGGEKTLEPIRSEFPYLTNKWALAEPGELDKIKHKSSILAALDYIVCLKSHVFMANHGGNMARSIQGHRAYLGHRKHITPNKKQLVEFFINHKKNNGNKSEEVEEKELIKKMHLSSMGSPFIRSKKSNKDVIAFPVPECMCRSNSSSTSRRKKRDSHSSI